jgi:hypothetical protein
MRRKAKVEGRPGFERKPAVPDGGVSEVDLELVRGTRKVVWEYIGEGWSGDYDPDRKGDQPLLRFSCYECQETGFAPDDPDRWRQMDDASYCTRMPVGTPTGILAQAAAVVLEAVEDACYKRRLEELSWLRPEDFGKRRARR